MKSIKFNCPNCGTEFTLTANNAKQNVSESKSKKSVRNVNEKLTALRNAGVDVSCLFAIRNAYGEEDMARITSCGMVIIDEDDPVFNNIMNGKTIPNRRLFRRWVMAQMFHMLTEKKPGESKPMGFTEALKRKGYMYTWKMLVEELRVQKKLYDDDWDNFMERSVWFNKGLVIQMAEHYMRDLYNHLKRVKCKMTKNGDCLKYDKETTNIDKHAINEYNRLAMTVRAIRKSEDLQELYNETRMFYLQLKKSWKGKALSQCPAWQDAYKGVGTYYTMKNLILFHGCRFEGMPSERESMDKLQDYNFNPEMEGYRMLGILKDFLETNNIDIEAKMAEWRKNLD